ncbi:hypothetical protein EQP59_03005 [Ornithobacterium rhinotracheale]|uniref:Uncharacterized protein n=1 Tax=Ornithobacterium rhinotracheale TaxID=28251 RepID=A0A3R5WZ00_ORNRH|nr:hypothetical protein [Ornithobacterium rhinotracheale]QAR30391.1 hypothetical protein EQP59_03005 [Ornithobacterium rhinotracheale]
MELPKFLLADNSSVEDAFVLHTEYPRFLINVHTDEVEWFDEIDEEEEEIQTQVNDLIEQAYAFFEDELEAYEELDEEE